MKTYHILNGDALKDRFPSDQISGEAIIMRECLIDGPVLAKTQEAFYQARTSFLIEAYGDNGIKYENSVIAEFNKIAAINNAEVNLWFEDDLFCQINLWYICSLIYKKNDIKVNLVRPNSSLQYGFGGLNAEELIQAYKQKMPLTIVNVNQLVWLWFTYQKNHVERLLKLSVQLSSELPFVKEAIISHIERETTGEKLGRPEQAILDIIKEKSSTDFEIVFREFSKREPIYGFGDLQLKRIFNRVIKTQ